MHDTLPAMSVPTEVREYEAWRQRHAQWRQRTRPTLSRADNPLFTVAIDCAAADLGALVATVDSLLAQRYRNVEITLCGVPEAASGGELPGLEGWTRDGYGFRGVVWEPHAVAVHALSRRIAGSCAPESRGDFVMCVPSGATLDPDCFDEICHALDSADLDRDPELILIDHDCRAADGGSAVPHLLWDWGLDQLQACDLIGASFAASRDVIERRGMSPCASVREWLLTLMGSGPEPEIVHVAAPLIHLPPPVKVAAVGDAIAGAGGAYVRESVAHQPDVPVPRGVSVVIPTRNRAGLLKECLGCLGVPRGDVEIVIVDNGSDEPDAIMLLEEMEQRGHVKVLRRPGPFNFSLLVNEGVAASSHPAVMLLNNDVRIADWSRVTHLIDYLWRDGVGVVGTTLHYPDGSVQHAGVVLWHAGSAQHVMRGAMPGTDGFELAHSHPRSLQAVTGALMLVRREVFDALGGFDQRRLPIEWNDVDFCLRARHAGWRVVCVPSRDIVHVESASRGKDATEHVLQMRRDAADRMMAVWSELRVRAPFMHANLIVADVPRPYLREPA